MNKTNIEWVKNPDGTQGYTWNPITGCLNHIDGLCEGGGFPCYAYKLANTRLKERYLVNKNTATDDYDEDSYPFYPRFWEDRLYQPYEVGSKFGQSIKGKGIFVCDMSDLFGIGIPEEWTNAVLNVIEHSSYNRYYLLTKQPHHLIRFNPFPDNCWVGVTITNRSMFKVAMSYMQYVEAKMKFVSFEPLLECVFDDSHSIDYHSLCLMGLDVKWIIIGGQTKPYKLPDLEWVKSITMIADRVNIPVFFKNNLKPLLTYEKNGDICAGYIWAIQDHGLRQEMPK